MMCAQAAMQRGIVIPRLAQHAEGPRKRSTAFAKDGRIAVKERLIFGGSLNSK
jgi:hypothetical protein